MSKKQKEIYNPIRKVNDKIYESLGNEISEEEWLKALKETKSKSALGLSDISYPLIKKVGLIAQKIFKHLANLYIREEEILAKQKLSQLYLILKGEDWNYNLSNIRLIILIKTFHKTVVRVLTYRLDKILVDFNILEGSNFAELSDDSTMSPIHIMNNILEDARQKNNKLYILF